jgi:hypothetical protein
MLDYSVNPRGIACEHFDDETIILNLPKGNYYSLKGTGQFIWSQLEKGAGSVYISELVSDYYGITLDESRSAVMPFLAQLAEEELIVQSTSTLEISVLRSPYDTSSQPFTIPTIEVYTDMQELLMLDPIHDADPGKGWPYQNNA